MVLRHSPFFRTLSEVVHSGRYGRLLFMEWTEMRPFAPEAWRYQSAAGEGDAILHDKAIHQIDIFNCLAGSPPELVMGMGGQYLIDPHKTRPVRAFNYLAQVRGDSFDHAMGLVRYANGVKASLLVSYCSPHARESRLIVQLERGKLVAYPEVFVRPPADQPEWGGCPSLIYLYEDMADSPAKVPWKVPMSYPPDREHRLLLDAHGEDSLHPGSLAQMTHFHEVAAGSAQPLTGLPEARAGLEVLNALHRSSLSGQSIPLDKFREGRG